MIHDQRLLDGSRLMDGPLPRRVFLRAAALAGAAGLAGLACGPAPTTPAPTQPAPGAAPASGAAPAATPPAAQPTPAAPAATPTSVVSEVGSGQRLINFWHGLSGADGKTMTELLREFAAANPDLKVREEVMQWNIFYQKFPTAVIANTPPDLVVSHEWAIPQLATRNVLRPMDDLYGAPKGDGIGGLPKEDFVPFAMNNITADGKIQGVLLDNHGYGMYVNATHFQKVGLDSDKPPSSGEEFVRYAQQLTVDRNGKHPNESGFDDKNVDVWGWAVGGTPTGMRWNSLIAIWQFGGDVLNEDGSRSLLNEDGATRGMQFLHDAVHRHKIAPVPVGFDANDAFGNGRLATMLNGSWFLNFVLDRPALHHPATKVWYTPKYGDKQVTWMSASVLAQPRQASGDKQEVTSRLMTWMSNNGLKWAASGQAPARRSQQNSPDLQSHWHTGLFAKQFQEIGRTERSHVNATEIQAVLEAEFPAILTGAKSVKDGLNDAHTRVQRVLDRRT